MDPAAAARRRWPAPAAGAGHDGGRARPWSPLPRPVGCPTGSARSPSATSRSTARTTSSLSFRRPFKRNLINVTRPRRAWADAHGLSAHLGLYRPDDLSSIWVAGTLVHPVIEVAACNGALAVAYGRLDEPGTVETGAWRWVVFGFLPVEPLPGPGTPICVDIDGDGRTEPAITGRSDP